MTHHDARVPFDRGTEETPQSALNGVFAEVAIPLEFTLIAAASVSA